MDPASALLLFTLFQATEKVIGYAGGKVADAMGLPIWEALEDKARWLAKNDDTAKRWRAFEAAFTEAQSRFEATAPNLNVAQHVSAVLANLTLDSTTDREWLSYLVPTPEKASVLSEKPDISTIAELIRAALQHKSESPPSRADLAD